MSFELVQYASRETMAVQLAGLLADTLATLATETGAARIAVPGGSTPAPMLSALANAAHVPWSQVTVTLTDERWVPPTDSRSNQRMLQETLLTGAARAAKTVPLYADAPDPEAGLAQVAQAIAPVLPLDVTVLGMGGDMHTASLFPGAEQLPAALAANAPPVMAIRPASGPEPRITLTAATLAAAECHILIQGAEKHAALIHAQELADPLQAPILAVLDGAIVHYAE